LLITEQLDTCSRLLAYPGLPLYISFLDGNRLSKFKDSTEAAIFIRIRMMADAFIVQFFHREQMRVS
jgi:hypothetical protein